MSATDAGPLYTSNAVTDPKIVAFCVVFDRVEEPAPGEVSVVPGHAANLIDVYERGTGERVYEGRLVDLYTKRLIEPPTVLKTADSARRWWVSVAPGAPVPEAFDPDCLLREMQQAASSPVEVATQHLGKLARRGGAGQPEVEDARRGGLEHGGKDG
jgi:hypothetical protein